MNLEASHSMSRRQLVRQVSHKTAQQQPVIPPLPLSEMENTDLQAFQALVEHSGEAWNSLPRNMESSCHISESLPLPTPPWQTTNSIWSQVLNTILNSIQINVR